MIHQYKLNGYNIVLDVYSGSVHAVDELAYDAIALIDAGHPRAEAAALLAAVLLRIRNRHYRKVEEEETADADQDGIPDVYEDDD